MKTLQFFIISLTLSTHLLADDCAKGFETKSVTLQNISTYSQLGELRGQSSLPASDPTTKKAGDSLAGLLNTVINSDFNSSEAELSISDVLAQLKAIWDSSLLEPQKAKGKLRSIFSGLFFRPEHTYPASEITLDIKFGEISYIFKINRYWDFVKKPLDQDEFLKISWRIGDEEESITKNLSNSTENDVFRHLHSSLRALTDNAKMKLEAKSLDDTTGLADDIRKVIYSTSHTVTGNLRISHPTKLHTSAFDSNSPVSDADFVTTKTRTTTEYRHNYGQKQLATAVALLAVGRRDATAHKNSVLSGAYLAITEIEKQDGIVYFDVYDARSDKGLSVDLIVRINDKDRPSAYWERVINTSQTKMSVKDLLTTLGNWRLHTARDHWYDRISDKHWTLYEEEE